jgi:hypothetical protein
MGLCGASDLRSAVLNALYANNACKLLSTQNFRTFVTILSPP